MNSKIKVLKIEQITPGARHYWLETSIGRIRKPIGSLDLEQYDFSEIEKNKIVLVENRLLSWGRWLVKCLAHGISYPSQSTLVTALQGSPATASTPLPDDSDAEQVERIVRKMHFEHKQWAEVLRKHYTRDLDTNGEDVAKAMEVPRRTYFYYLNMGRKKVELYLKK